MFIKSKFIVLICSIITMMSCRSVSMQRDSIMTVSIKDSLVWKRTSGDSLLKVPSSTISVTLPPSFEVGGNARIERKQGQATVIAEKNDSTIVITAVCDSLEFHVKILNEELMKMTKENSVLKEQLETSKISMVDKLIDSALPKLLILLIILGVVNIFIKKKSE